MRQVTLALMLVALGFPPSLGATEKEARVILDRAIKAHGGADALARALLCKRTDSGTQTVVTREVPFVSQVTRSLPDRVRLQIELDKKITTTLVLDGVKGWQTEGDGPASNLGLARIKEMREEAYVWWLTTLTPLTKPGFTLSALPRSTVDGEAMVGIKVVRKGYADTKLYFRERSGLLAKIERRTSEGGTIVDKEYLYSSYKEYSGLTVPTREIVKVNGRKYTEFTSTNYSFPAKLDAGTFTKP